ADLPAPFGIEGRLVDDDLDLLALFGRLDKAISFEDGQDFALPFEIVIAQESCGPKALGERRVDGENRLLAASLPCRPCEFTLTVHGSIESGEIERQPLIPDDFLGQVQRKTVGVIKLKDFLSRDLSLTALARLICDPGKHSHAAFERVRKTLLLMEGDIGRKLSRGIEFGISTAHFVGHNSQHSVEKRLGEAEHTAMAGGSPDDAP